MITVSCVAGDKVILPRKTLVKVGVSTLYEEERVLTKPARLESVGLTLELMFPHDSGR